MREGRVFVTINVRHFARLAVEMAASGLEHPGIILANQKPIGSMVRALLGLLEIRSAAELWSNVWWV